jgi:sulfate adenylyltransferase
MRDGPGSEGQAEAATSGAGLREARRGLIAPWGGRLHDLRVADAERRAELRARAAGATSVVLSERSRGDLELLSTGAYAPLSGFLGAADHERVLAEMRLADGTLWPVPVSLPLAAPAAPGTPLALRDDEGELRALLTVEECFEVDPEDEARALWGDGASEHPLRAELLARGRWRASGVPEVLARVPTEPFAALRATPAEVRARLEALGSSRVVAFQTRNAMHRVHEWIAKTAQDDVGGTLLVHPTVGPSMADDADPCTRVRAIRALVRAHFDPARTVLATLALPMWMAGPREALFHALVRRNYGADHLVVGRDHAGPGRLPSGRPCFPPEAAAALVAAHAAESGVAAVPFGEVVYDAREERFARADDVAPGTPTRSISGTEVRERLATGRPLPAWFTRPEAAAALASSHPPPGGEGVCVWFTGLPAAGKSTLARALAARFEEGGRRATILDGDVVRALLSKGLGFSREDRDANVARIAYVASEVVRHGGVAIVAAVSPFEAAREAARVRVGTGRFVLVHLATPLAVCEARDGKGLYAAGRAGRRRGVTGLDDPYEAPRAPDLVLDASTASPDELLDRLAAWMAERALPSPPPS